MLKIHAFPSLPLSVSLSLCLSVSLCLSLSLSLSLSLPLKYLEYSNLSYFIIHFIGLFYKEFGTPP